MPLSFPRSMPTAGVMGLLIELNRVDYIAPESGGNQGGVQAGLPRWTLKQDLNNLLFDDAAIWSAWQKSLRGSQRMFIATDLWLPFPAAYPDGFARATRVNGSPFTGAASAWSQTIDADGNAVLHLEGLPSGFRLSADDYIGFKWDSAGAAPGTFDRRTMSSALIANQSDADGAVDIIVEPAVPNLVPAGAIAHLDSASCLMKLTADGATKMGRKTLSHVETGGMISAAQVLLP